MGKKRGSLNDSKIDVANGDSTDSASPLGAHPFNNSQPFISLSNGIQDWHIKALLLLTVIGAILRFYHLDYNSIWLDEGASYFYAQKSLLGIWDATSSGEYNPPLFYWIEHFMLLLGGTEVILRLVPAVLGILTIPLFYIIGEEFMDQNSGLIAAAIISFSPFHIFYSQEARAYTSVLFVLSLAFICYLYGRRSNKSEYWILFGFFSAVAFWMHFYSIIFTGILILFGFFRPTEKSLDNPSDLKQILTASMIFIVLCAPLLLVIGRLFLIRTSSHPAFGGQGLLFISESIWEISGFSNIAELILIALFIIGIIQLSKFGTTGSMLIVSGIMATFLASFVLSYKMPMEPRYIIFLLPLFYSGVAAAYKLIFGVWPRKIVIYIFITVLFLANVQFYSEYYNNYYKSDWRDFSKELQSITREGDFIIVLPGYNRAPLDYYYSNKSDRTIEFGASTAEDLERLYGSIKPARTFFVITNDLYAADSSKKSVRWLQNNSRDIKMKSGIGNKYAAGIKLRLASAK